MKNIKFGVLLTCLLTLDIFSKFYIVKTFKEGNRVNLLSNILELNYVNNSGFAFSLGSNFSSALLIIYFIALIVIFYFFKKTKINQQYALVILVAGILGNGLDRLQNGSVVDFISLNHFAIFNLADCFITFSLLYLVLNQKKEG
jgi:signal peptidase II